MHPRLNQVKTSTFRHRFEQYVTSKKTAKLANLSELIWILFKTFNEK